MWFGTQNGLTRYDGVNFVVYEYSQEDTNSLSYNIVSSVFEDSDKNLWIGTFVGLNLYNRQKDNFEHICHFQNLVLSSICEDQNHHIWVGTIGNGVYKFNHKNNTVENFYNSNPDIHSRNSNHITSMVFDSNNRLWVGSWNGLILMDTDGKIIKHFRKEPEIPGNVSDNYVNALSIEGDSVLWIGTIYGGLDRLCINDKDFKIKNYHLKYGQCPPSSILSMVADKRNNLWIGIENNGLLTINTQSGITYQYKEDEGNEYSISSNLIRSIYIDDLNILWIGTIGRGVNFFDERNKHFERYKKNPYNINSLCGNDVRCFTEDRAGNIWIATYDGICMFDVKKQMFTHKLSREKGGLSSNAINSIVFDADENLWIGTINKGIDRYNRKLEKTGNFKIKGVQKVGENKINTLYIDKKNDLWAGTSGSGLFKYNKKNQSFAQIYNEPEGVGPNEFGYVFSIVETYDGKIWIGTAYRLFCLTRKENNTYSFKIYTSNTSPDSIKSNSIYSLYEDSRKNLWIGSIDRGLFLFNNKTNTFVSYSKKDGLPGNSLTGLVEDNHGNLWISTTTGIAKFNIDKKSFTNYNKEDGLVSNEYNINSCLKSTHGMLFFGSNEGFNSFYPGDIKENSSARPVCLTDLKIFNQSVQIGAEGSPLTRSIGETDKIVLKHNQSSFSIGFVSLNYIRGSKSQYMFILEGLEEKWNTIKNGNVASYSYVKPGKYVFKVKGSNNDGVWNNTPAVLEIVVLPPFWKSDLAYVIYVLLCILIIYAIIHYRVAIVKQMHLAELNQMKLQFFANISHEFRTPLSLIISPVENLFAHALNNKEIKYQLELIYKNANRLFRLVNEIMYFYKAVDSKLSISVQYGDIAKFTEELSHNFHDESLRRQITFNFIAKPHSIEAWFDPEKYEKIILNLLSNAFKFTQDNGCIKIKLEKHPVENIRLTENEINIPKVAAKEFLKITVIDNGKGISVTDLHKIFDRFYQANDDGYIYQSGTGIGLSLTKTLVELHHGKIYASSEIGKETCFTILLPLGNNHFRKSEIIVEPVDIKINAAPPQNINEETQEDAKTLPPNAPLILLVEDNFELRKYIVNTLSKKYRIIEAGDGDTGYKQAVDNSPDLIISDIIMPVLSGIELCRLLKGDIITSHIPVILLTAKTTLEDKINGIETGADSYITKPFNVKYLEAVIKNLIDTRKKLFQRFSQDVYILPKEMSDNPLDQNFLEKIIEYIEENLARSELSVEELSSHLLMSPGHTWRKVKSLTGQTTNEFIRTIRLKKSIKIMEEGNYNISEIAYRVGFSSPAYFTKCFKEQYGKSPTSFLSNRKNNSQNS